MSAAPTVGETDRRHYRDHGFVALRGVLPLDLVRSLHEPVERAAHDHTTTADLTVLGDALAGRTPTDPDRGRFRSGVDHWRHDAQLRAFATTSPLVALVASLLDTATLHLYEDSVLVKEPGSAESTVFHQDHPYFSVDGDLVCTTWVPLDVVTRESGAMGYVRGSHRDPTEWRPNLFVTRDAIPGTEGADVPDLHADPGAADIVWIEAEPGDVLVHHARTIHGAGPNRTADRSRRAVSVRYCGDGVVFRRRAVTPKPHHEGFTDGAPLAPPAFPQVWPITPLSPGGS